MRKFVKLLRAGLSGRLAESPNLRCDWRWLIPVGVVVWAVAVLLRMLDYPMWDTPMLQMAKEYILATHDSYLWLSVAEGVRPEPGLTLMPEFTVAAMKLLGMTPGQVGFWMPAILSGLGGTACLLWGWLLGGRWAGLAAGLIGANVPGVFYRTRLGYYDTDLFIMTLPILAWWGLAMLIAQAGRSTWREPESWTMERMYGVRLLALALGVGLLARTGTWWHVHITEIGKLLFWPALGLGFFLVRREDRGRWLQVSALFAMAAYAGSYAYGLCLSVPALPGTVILVPGWIAVVSTAALFGAVAYAGSLSLSRKTSFWVGIGALAIMTMCTQQFMQVGNLLAQALGYLKPATEAAGTAVQSGAAVPGPTWPGITQSIVEAASVDWVKVLDRLGPTPWLAALGILGYVFVVAARPLALLLAPFLGLGLAGGVLGIRFTMFGAPAVAVGLAVPLCWTVGYLVQRYANFRWAEPVAQSTLAVLLMLPMVFAYSNLVITPVLTKPHAQALMSLRDKGAQDSQVWTWWDYGYAAQYYSGKMTPSDGGKHAGREIFPTALAFTTDSMRQAAQVIRYGADNGGDPWKQWASMPAVEVAELLDSMKLEERDYADQPPQYVVAPWEIMRIMEWITFYGNWDVVTGETVRGKSKLVPRFRVDPRGAVVTPDEQAIPISSIDVLDGESYKHKNFTHTPGAPHFIMNEAYKQAYLVDDVVYNSAIVQLLVAPPDTPWIANHFELVHDDIPHVRIYRVK